MADEYITGADGTNLWDELIKRHSNVFMTLSGHIGDTEYRQRIGLSGNVVHEILTDYQYEKRKGTGDPCGNGWIRLFQFKSGIDSIKIITKTVAPDDETIFTNPGYPEFYYTTYSSDPENRDHQYSIYYDMSSGVNPNIFEPNIDHFRDRVINSVGSGNQYKPDIATSSNGNFVVVWEDDNDNNGSYDIRARGLSSDGCEVFSDMVVNTLTSGQQKKPAIAMDSNGNFVVVWEDDNDNNNSYDIYVKGFNSNGTQRFAYFRVNTVSSGQQLKPAIAMDSNGNFVVVWEDDNDNNGSYQIFARGFNSNGTQRFADITVNTVGSGQQKRPDVAMDSNGNFVVVWQDDNDNNDYYDIMARGFNANGTQRFADITVNSVASGQQYSPKIAMDPNGNFVVAYEDDNNNNDTYDIKARGFNANGTQRFADFIVNTNHSDNQVHPAIAMSPNGNFVVVWEWQRDNLLGMGYREFYVLARGFYSNSTQLFPDMYVSSILLSLPCNFNCFNHQFYPSVIFRNDGSYVCVWEDDYDNNDYYEIMGRGVQHFTLSVSKIGSGSVTPSGDFFKPSGSFTTHTATPLSGYKFDGWTGDVESPVSATTKVFIDGNKQVVAHFSPITSVEGIEFPLDFALYQNYPNPFNPSTTIKYQIPELSFVIIKVLDVLGKEVAKLVNEEKPVGNYEIEFNATGLPSGVYFYQLKSGDYVSTKKMILIK